ncbi:hypothetical protein VNO77_42010 [Canavalia gladiata]|uniref:Uncharacterized protein n=1 Tax=Canavalia gladiata TaxID=3824 RepID=A0AAN9PS16_CANGL
MTWKQREKRVLKTAKIQNVVRFPLTTEDPREEGSEFPINSVVDFCSGSVTGPLHIVPRLQVNPLHYPRGQLYYYLHEPYESSISLPTILQLVILEGPIGLCISLLSDKALYFYRERGQEPHIKASSPITGPNAWGQRDYTCFKDCAWCKKIWLTSHASKPISLKRQHGEDLLLGVILSFHRARAGVALNPNPKPPIWRRNSGLALTLSSSFMAMVHIAGKEARLPHLKNRDPAQCYLQQQRSLPQLRCCCQGKGEAQFSRWRVAKTHGSKVQTSPHDYLFESPWPSVHPAQDSILDPLAIQKVRLEADMGPSDRATWKGEKVMCI